MHNEKMKKKKQIEFKEDGFGTHVKTNETEYDIIGNIISSIEYFDSGTISQEISYEYEKGKLVKEVCWNENGNHVEITYEYNKKEELVERRTNYQDGSFEIEKRTLNDNQEVIENFDENGKIEKKQILQYLEDGKVCKNEFYEFEELLEKSEYEYENGELKKRIVHDVLEGSSLIVKFEEMKVDDCVVECETLENENGELLQSIKNTFKNEQLIMKEIEYRDFPSDSEICRFEYENGLQLKETIFDFQGNKISECRYCYNEYNDLIEIISVDYIGNDSAGAGVGGVGSKSLSFYEYEYFE